MSNPPAPPVVPPNQPYEAFQAYKDITGVLGLSGTTLWALWTFEFAKPTLHQSHPTNTHNVFVWDTISGWAAQTPHGTPPGQLNEDWGVPWCFTTQSGMENMSRVYDPSTREPVESLLGSGGPWPEIHLYNERGEHMAQETRPIGYLREGTTDSRLVFPDYPGKPYHDLAWVVLKQNKRDPICIVDFSIAHMSPAGQEKGADAFGSITAQTCGLKWYWSNIYRKGREGFHDEIPCFWLGTEEANVFQAHMPTLSRTNVEISANLSHDVLWNYFCNKPTVLSWYDKLPRGGTRHVPELDWSKDRGKNYTEDFEENFNISYANDTWRGEKYKKPVAGGKKKPAVKILASALLVSSEEGLTVEHKAEKKSAAMLCNSRTAAGPDYVNVPEGLFCRMADKTLFPLCNFNDAEGLHEDCFDVESEELVLKGRRLLRRSQYAFVRHRGRNHDEESAAKSVQ